MPDPRRYLILIGLTALAAALSILFGRYEAPAPARWPADGALYQVEGWTTGSLAVDSFDQPEPGAILQRTYVSARGEPANLVVWTVPQPHAKTLFRKGADRDYLGAGYTSEDAPAELPRPINGGARIARRGAEAWLLLYTYGERRGVLGDGLSAWLWAGSDALLDRPNDYFLARVRVPYDTANPPRTSEATRLLDVLASRLAAWYAS